MVLVKAVIFGRDQCLDNQGRNLLQLDALLLALVESGQLQVFVTGGPPRSHRLAKLGAGAMLGEPALFGTAPRMANVEAVTATVVWSLCARRLHELAGEAPALVLEVLRAAGALMAARICANQERGIPTV